MAKGWAKFPYPEKSYVYSAASLKKVWPDLHRGDAEPFPKDGKVVEGWIAFHAGDFYKAYATGLAEGEAGVTLANKAQAIYANYLEEDEKKKLKMFEEVAERAAQQQADDPKNPNAYYWQAYALGRYAQGISIVKALAAGIGGTVKTALDTALKLQPKHADAHTTIAAWHAEIIDKVGSMVGGLTYGAKKDAALKHYETALKLNPDSAITKVEYANGLVMLEGKKALAKAESLYGEAANTVPRDAMERLDIELARAELED